MCVFCCFCDFDSNKGAVKAAGRSVRQKLDWRTARKSLSFPKKEDAIRYIFKTVGQTIVVAWSGTAKYMTWDASPVISCRWWVPFAAGYRYCFLICVCDILDWRKYITLTWEYLTNIKSCSELFKTECKSVIQSLLYASIPKNGRCIGKATWTR